MVNFFTIMLSIMLAFAPAPKQELSIQQIDEAKAMVEYRHEQIREEARLRAEEQKETTTINNITHKIETSTENSEIVEETVVETTEANLELWGTYNVTFYCPCPQHCNSWIGARGNRLTEYYSVAMPNLPMGTVIEIRGSLGYDGRYVVEDISPRGICDIFVNDHSQIPSFGTCRAEIYIVR